MPNHVTNEIIFRNVGAETQAHILALVENAKGEIDFDVLVPTPKNIWWGNVGSDHEATFKRTAMDWSRENWGTKWNAYGQKPREQTEDTLTIVFDTAWNPPANWLCALFNTLLLPFEVNILSEGWDRAQSWSFAFDPDGRMENYIWRHVEATDEMHRHMHKLRWGVEEFPPEEAA